MIQKITTPKIRKRGDSYQLDFAIYTDGKRQRVRLQHKRRGHLVDQYNQIAEEARLGTYGAPKPEQQHITLAGLIERYSAQSTAEKRPRTADRESYTLASLLEEIDGTLDIRRITQLHIDTWKAARLTSCAPGTVKRDLGTVRAMFNRAKAWGYIDENPAAGVTAPKVPEGKVVYLEIEDQIRLVNAARTIADRANGNSRLDMPYLPAIIITALHTGLRISEILGLTWSRVDLERKTLEAIDTKTGQRRHLAMTDDMHHELKAWNEFLRSELAAARANATDKKLSRKQQKWASERMEILIPRQPGPGRPVFPSFRILDDNGQAVPIKDVGHAWDLVRTLAFGVDTGKKDKKGKPIIEVPDRYRNGIHSLRHTFGTTLARARVPMVRISRAMGHRSIRTTERNYMKFSPEEGRDVADKLPRLVTSVAHVDVAEERRKTGSEKND